MNLPGMLYQLILSPFEFLLSSVFSGSYKLTGNYGLSLVLMSFFITAITAPLYYLAEKWKNAEKAIQYRMARDIAGIKKHYTGQKRFYLIQTAHRVFNYKSWYSFRTSFGLLIQIPFFFAAYDVLSRFEGYRGVPFLFIQDLAKPDALLGGINLLPFAMTAVNVVYSFYYTKSKSIRENSQLLVMAFLFLALLYSSPSALLVYWTMNNVFSLIKGIAFRKLGLNQNACIPEFIPEKMNYRKLVSENRKYLFFLTIALFFSLQVFWMVYFDESFKYSIAFFSLSAAVSAGFFLVKNRSAKKTIHLLLLASVFLFFLYLFFFYRKNNPLISNKNLKLSVTLLADLIIYYCCTSLFSVQPIRHSGKILPLPFFLIITSFFSALFLFNPLTLYFASPADIGSSLGHVAAFTASIFAVFMAFFLIVYAVSGMEGKKRLYSLVVFLFIISVVYSFILKLNTGMLDSFTFQNEQAVTGMSPVQYVLDAFILTGILFFSDAIAAKYRNEMAAVSLILTLVLGVNLALHVSSIPKAAEEKSAADAGALPENAKEMHRLSRTGRNTVFYIADMANGNYITRLLEQYPEYREKLEGFTHYPDTLSISYNTGTSMPAIFGGDRYYPLLLNGNGSLGIDEIRQTASSFFREVADAGYAATVCNPVYFSEADVQGASVESIYAYADAWRKKNGISVTDSAMDKTPLLLMLSLFNSSPFSLKYSIYDGGKWLVYRSSALFKGMRNNAIGNLAFIDLLPDLSASDGVKDRFLYIHNELQHAPYGIKKDGTLIDNEYPDEEGKSFTSGTAAFYSAKKEIDVLLKWFDWMKENQVWDNTSIIIISDHGNSFNDNGILLPEGVNSYNARYDVSRANTLLMVKPRFSRGPMLSSNTEMSSADIPAITAVEAGLRPVYGPDRRTTTGARTRLFSSITVFWDDFVSRESVPYRSYAVNGPIFNPASWSLYDQKK